MPAQQWRTTLTWYVAIVVGTAAFPRFGAWLRWSVGPHPRGLIAYAAFNTASVFALRVFLLPRLREMVERQDQARDELRERLGREPTERELVERLGVRARDA